MDHEDFCKRYWDLRERVRSDAEYARLTREQRDLIDRIVVLRESMGRRMLECACEELLFPETTP